MMPTTDAEKLTLNVKTVIGLCIGICGFLVWGVTNQNNITSEQKNLTSEVGSLRREVNELRATISGFRIGEIQLQLDVLRRNGSDAVQTLAKELASFSQSIEAYRLNGSPGEERRISDLDRRVSEIEKQFEVHKIKEEQKTK